MQDKTLENEKESEAWQDYGLAAFRCALESQLDESDSYRCDHEDHAQDECPACPAYFVAYAHDPDLLSDDDLTELWYDGCDAFNVNGGSGYVNEQGDSIHFYIDEWIDRFEQRGILTATCGAHKGQSFNERVRTLAICCRTHDTDPALLAVARDAWLVDANGEHTISLLNQIAPDYHAAILYAWENERTANERNASDA